MRIKIINEFELDKQSKKQVAGLLQESFPDYPEDEVCLKQYPSFRIVCLGQKDQLIGHIAVEYRRMNLANNPISVYGLADICVNPAFRQKKVATQMLEFLSDLGQSRQIDFLVLIAYDPDVYTTQNFKLVHNPCRWLLLHNNRSLGIVQRSSLAGLMVKKIGSRSWQEGQLDFMGPIF